MINTVLDASALLAFLLDEPGQELVDDVLADAGISSVNWCEVLQQLVKHGADITGCQSDLEALGLKILDFNAELAERTATLWLEGQAYGLSLGDRACIALGMMLDLPILTADRIWATTFPTLEIQLIR